MDEKIKVRFTVPETLSAIANRFLQSLAYPTQKPDGELSPPTPISVERESGVVLGDYLVESLKFRPLGIDSAGDPRAMAVEVLALPIKNKFVYTGPRGADDVFVCPECKVEHSRGPLDPLSKVYRCLGCGYAGPKGEAEKKKETPPIPTEVRDELDDDVEIYGNAFALFSRGEWRRLDPLKVKLDLREKETADDPCPKCEGTGRKNGTSFPDPCPKCKGTGRA